MKKHTLFEVITKNLHQFFTPKAKVTHDARLLGQSGLKRKIDVLIEDKIGPYELKIVVDCKYYSKKVDVNEIDTVWGIVDDVKANLGVIVSNAGFTKGAVKRAKTLGILKLCSLVDLENKDFSIKIALPVIYELRSLLCQIELLSKDPKLIIDTRPGDMSIKHKNGRISTVYNEFFTLWNKGKIPDDPGPHSFSFFPKDWILIGSKGEFKFDKLNINYEVIPTFYLGMVPIIEGKGIVDIQENVFKTKGFKMDWIKLSDVQEKWGKFSKLEDIKVEPFMHIVASSFYKLPKPPYSIKEEEL